MSLPGKTPLPPSHRLILVLVLVGTLGTAMVGGAVWLVYAPTSPGLPFVSPTYQAQPATAQYYGVSLNAALYGVWYVPGSTTLILEIMAGFPHTHFLGVGPIGQLFSTFYNQTNSPEGNFSTPVYVDNQKTFLVFPGNTCPNTGQIPSSGYTVQVQLVADAPPGILSFQYTCVKQLSLTVLTLGNPHIIVPSLIPPTTPPPITTGRESLSMDSYSFNSSNTSVALFIRNTGTVSVSFASYYVKDSSGNQWARTSWAGPTINPNAVAGVGFAIGSACGSCTYSGGSGAFNQFSPGYSYTLVVVTARNNQFSFTVTR